MANRVNVQYNLVVSSCSSLDMNELANRKFSDSLGPPFRLAYSGLVWIQGVNAGHAWAW